MNNSSPFLTETLHGLASGRHYSGATDGDVWVMAGRDLHTVDEWFIIPPSASLTLAISGGCEITTEIGSFTVSPGAWMWIDAGVAHRGRNMPGSDFLTVFFSTRAVTRACLHVAPIVAGALPAPGHMAQVLIGMAEALLGGRASSGIEAPARDAILDWVGENFPPAPPADATGDAFAVVRNALRKDPTSGRSLADLAQEAGLSVSQLSRGFARKYNVPPVTYRRQLRLALATRLLVETGSISRAARGAGFADAAHLSRTFRAQYAIPPSVWLRSMCLPAA